jgi:hypothetical protein
VPKVKKRRCCYGFFIRLRYTIQNSQAIYVSEEIWKGKFRRAFLYTAIASIPLKDQKPKICYFVVVVREEPHDLRFVTAYYTFALNEYIRIISPTHFYEHIT